jgi:hypothetical protein
VVVEPVLQILRQLLGGHEPVLRRTSGAPSGG